MDLHPLAMQFGAIAEAYERGRPDYPPEVVERLRAELELPAGARVLDLGAGTGKLTRALLSGGLDVVAVEPQESLRALLTRAVGAERVLAGLAEEIPLDDRSVAAVTVADAFHWFDPPRALQEIRRVLRPGGGLAVLISAVDWSGASWAHEVGTVIMELRPEHPQFDGPSWETSVKAAAGWAPPREIGMSFSQQSDPERIVNHIASMSWMAGLPEDGRRDTLARIDAIIRAGETPAQLPVHLRIGLATLT